MKGDIVDGFVGAINDHDVDRIRSLMTRDHTFIDAHGNEVTGTEKMKAAWIGYFRLFPDYRIEITNILSRGDTFALFGFASGSYGGNGKKPWRLPAAWKATVSDGKIKLWQVYADTKIPFESISRDAKLSDSRR
jgi:ketosteroid isomerase-like protein